MGLLQDGAQLRGDPLREMARHPAADADDLDVRDRSQPLAQFVDAAVREQQGVPPRHDDVPDLGVLLEITKRRLELGHGDLLRIADLAAPGAKATVRGADRRHEEQGAVGVAVRDVGDGGVRILRERVHEPVVDFELLEVRYVLPPDRVARGLDQVHHGRGDPELEVSGCLPEPFEIREVLGAELGHQRF